MDTQELKTDTAAGSPLAKVFEKLGAGPQALSGAGHDLVGCRHQAGGNFSGSLWLRFNHTDHLVRNRFDLGLFHHLVLSHRLGQGKSLSPL